jgi:sodium-dependent dicarboxylate transporter 2/3/5
MSSNIALTTLMMTIAHSLLKAGQRKEGESNLGRCLAIAIPWAVVVGSFLTPWGNPINLMIIGIVDTTFGISIPFTTWIAMGLLPVVLILLSMWFALMKIYKPEPLPQEAVDYGIERTSELPAMTIREKLNVVVIIATIVLWIAGGWIPILNTTTVVLVALAVMFMPKIRFISFNDYIKDSPWGLILMLLSINAIIAAITVSGATNWLMENVISNVSGFSPLIIILICSLIGIVLDNLIPSGPANAGLLTVPFVGFMVASGSDVTTMAMVIAWWAGIAYLMPLSAINMVTYQGYQYYAFGDMARAGWIPMIMQLASTMLLFPLIAMLLSAP